MTADVIKGAGYGVLTQNSAAAILAAKGYGVTTNAGHAAAVVKGTGYQLYGLPSSVVKGVGYVLPFQGVNASMNKGVGYAVFLPMFPPTANFNVDFDFMEEQFPECISFGSSGGPGFKTNVTEFDSGYVSVNKEWERLRARYSITFETATPEDIKQVEDFFYAAKGRAIGFRFKDWQDYQIVAQNIGIGDGTTTAFSVFKRYTSGTRYYDRKITKLRKLASDGLDMRVTVDNVLQGVGGQCHVNESLGIITFNVAPPPGAIVRIEYGEFDVPVRFDTDELDISFDEFRQLSLEVPLIEVLV